MQKFFPLFLWRKFVDNAYYIKIGFRVFSHQNELRFWFHFLCVWGCSLSRDTGFLGVFTRRDAEGSRTAPQSPSLAGFPVVHHCEPCLDALCTALGCAEVRLWVGPQTLGRLDCSRHGAEVAGALGSEGLHEGFAKGMLQCVWREQASKPVPVGLCYCRLG